MTAADMFQQEMSVLSKDMPFIKVYLDDILIVSYKDESDHLDKLSIVLRRLLQANLKVKTQKCEFLQKEVECLGFHISDKGIHPAKNKIEGLLQMSPPTTRKELKRFLGMFNHHKRLYCATDLNLEILHTLTSPNKTFRWILEAQKVFDDI